MFSMDKPDVWFTNYKELTSMLLIVFKVYLRIILVLNATNCDHIALCVNKESANSLLTGEIYYLYSE